MSCGLLPTARARADLLPPALDEGLLGALAGAALAATVLLSLAVWLRWRLAQVSRKAAERDAEARFLETIRAATPQAWCAWRDSEPLFSAEAFARMFGLRRVDGFTDIAAALVPEDGAALSTAFGRLRQTGPRSA